MYFVPDGTQVCGYYECKDCGSRFLALSTEPTIVCIYCGEEMDMELGPDEEAEGTREHAVLVKIVEGEDVEMMDRLLSLAITGGEWEWI